MKILEKSFVKYGYQYKQLLREGDYAIYERQKEGQNKEYEAIIIKRHNGYELAGQKIEPAEIYPGNSQFGNMAYSCISYERALVRLEELKNKGIKEEISLNWPGKSKFLVKDIQKSNPDISVSKVNMLIRESVDNNTLKIVGEKKNKKGKNSKIYSLV